MGSIFVQTHDSTTKKSKLSVGGGGVEASSPTTPSGFASAWESRTESLHPYRRELRGDFRTHDSSAENPASINCIVDETVQVPFAETIDTSESGNC